MLKIAGVKSEKEFYKKFPTEEAFMAKHGKAFKKAQIGTYMTSGSAPAPFQPLDVYGMQSDINYAVTGMTDEERRQLAALGESSVQPQQGQDSGQLTALASALSESGAAKKGKNIKKSQGGNRVPTGGLPRIQTPTRQQLTAGMPSQTITPSATPTAPKQPINWAKGIPVLGKVIGGVQKIKEQKRQYETAQQQKQLTDVFAQAAASRPMQQPKRKYLRPEDTVLQPEQMFPSYGVGTNVLAEFGASVGGGEIANTYAPNTLYDNLGYEPLSDSERYKQFYHGGKMQKAQTGVEQFLGSSQGQSLATALGGGDTGGGWGDILGGVGGLAGGPIGFAARFVGSAIDREKQKKIENQQKLASQNIGNIVGQSTGMAIQNMNRSYMEDGGTTSPYEWVSHTWQPQVITTFGEHKLKDLLTPPKDADMLRAGGHLREYTPPSARAMSTERPVMQMGGELQTHWGGYAEPMSQNPYLPDGGETVMFRGQSHDESDGKGNTGIGITYGENPVEVERGEPAMKMKDGSGGDSSLVVFGNLKIPNSYLPFLGEDAKGKKFKTYVSDLSKKENRQNKKIDKATEMLSDFEVSTPIDKLTLNSLQYTMLGANQKLKDLAEKKITAASLQNAINDTAEEYGLIADDLAKGKVTVDKKAMKEAAKYGKEIQKAQLGGFFGPIMAPILGFSRTAPSASTVVRAMFPAGSTVGGFPITGIPNVEDSKKVATVAPATAPVAAPAVEDVDETDVELIPIDKPAPTQRSTPRVTTSTGDDYVSKYGLTPWKGDLTTGIKNASAFSAKDWDAVAEATGFTGKGNKEFQEHLWNIPEIRDAIVRNHQRLYGQDPTSTTKNWFDNKLGAGWAAPELKGLGKKPQPVIPSGDLKIEKQTTTTGESTTKVPGTVPIVPYKRNPLLDIVGQVLPYLRPTDQEELDPRQLIGEMYALSTNELEPVQAQTLQPQLSVPYDISLQDILNENQAAYRAQQKMTGYNPALQSLGNADLYAANQKVLGEQLRLNQGMKDQVYRENRNILNQYGLKNLEILDRQYVRQAEAKSKTKAVTQAALNSIGDKFMRNQLENRTLATMENLYNYRYDPRFRAVNMNAPFQPQIPTVYVGPDGKQYQTITPGTSSTNKVPAAAPSATPVSPVPPPINFEQRPYTMEELSGGTFSGKEGVKVSKKKSLNSSVLKAFKNL